jgi:hypothetical protein
LVKYYFVIASFDLWSSKGAHDIFALMINFLGVNWQPKHIMIELFETMHISKQSLANTLIELLENMVQRKKKSLMRKIRGQPKYHV